MLMTEKYIKKLIRLVEESEIDSLEVSSWGRRVKITHKSTGNTNGYSHQTPTLRTISQVSDRQALSTASPTPIVPAQPIEAEDSSKFVEIKSPMVGTFYSAPSPDADPYVQLGNRVVAGQVVCIVEAMKLMNEIESEVTGKVVKVLGQNGKPVEFGQALFLIDPNG